MLPFWRLFGTAADSETQVRNFTFFYDNPKFPRDFSAKISWSRYSGALTYVMLTSFFFLASLSTSSADSASDHEFSFGTKKKGGNIGLNGNGTPVTFSHRYSEKAPSVGKSKMPNASNL